MADTQNESPSIQNGPPSLSSIFLHGSYEAADVMVTRYPYAVAVVLMVTTAELVKEKILDQTHFRYIYILVGLYFVAGTMLSFDIFSSKRFFALVMVLLTCAYGYFEYITFKNEQLAFRTMTKSLGVVGCYLSVAGGISKNRGAGDRNKHLLVFGRQMLGVNAMLTGMLLWNSDEEFNIQAKLLPGGEMAAYAMILVYLTSCLFIYGGYGVVMCSKVFAAVLLLSTIIVDLNFDAWKKTTGINQWTTISIATKNIPILSVLLLIRKGYY